MICRSIHHVTLGIFVGFLFSWQNIYAEIKTSDTCKFDRYKQKIFTGKPAAPRLNSAFAKNFQTRIRQAGMQAPNFAGQLVLTTWGCGIGCFYGGVVNLATGEVHELPFTLFRDIILDRPAFIYHANSALLVVSGYFSEDDRFSSTRCYNWKGNHFSRLGTCPCSFSSPYPWLVHELDTCRKASNSVSTCMNRNSRTEIEQLRDHILKAGGKWHLQLPKDDAEAVKFFLHTSRLIYTLPRDHRSRTDALSFRDSLADVFHHLQLRNGITEKNNHKN